MRFATCEECGTEAMAFSLTDGRCWYCRGTSAPEPEAPLDVPTYVPTHADPPVGMAGEFWAYW